MQREEKRSSLAAHTCETIGPANCSDARRDAARVLWNNGNDGSRSVRFGSQVLDSRAENPLCFRSLGSDQIGSDRIGSDEIGSAEANVVRNSSVLYTSRIERRTRNRIEFKYTVN